MKNESSKSPEQQAIEALSPVKPEFKKDELSKVFPKDEIFNKKKLYFIKGKNGQKEFVCDWRKLNISGTKVVLFKGTALSNAQLALFDKDAKNFYLESKVKSSES